MSGPTRIGEQSPDCAPGPRERVNPHLRPDDAERTVLIRRTSDASRPCVRTELESDDIAVAPGCLRRASTNGLLTHCNTSGKEASLPHMKTSANTVSLPQLETSGRVTRCSRLDW